MIISQKSGKISKIAELNPGQETQNYRADSSAKYQGNSNINHLPGTDCIVQSQISLSAYTSYRVGGAAEWYVSPHNIESLRASIEYAHKQDLPITILGAGSNLLVSDRGISGLVISTRHLRSKHFDQHTGQITVAAGEPIPSLAYEAASLGWEGLEWAVGIPGTIGGAVVMNAGAHNSCIGDMLISAEVFTPEGQLKTLTAAELGYTYRSSLLQGSKLIVTQATLQLQPGSEPAQVTAKTKQHKQH